MNWFRNMAISKKLLSSFVAVALIAGAMGLFGVINIRNSDAEYSELYDDYGVAVGDLGSVGIDFNIVRLKTRDIFLAKTNEEKEVFLNDIKQIEKNMQDELKAFERSIKDEDVYQSFQALQEVIATYNVARDKAINLAFSNQNEQAIDVFYSEGTKPAKEAESLINHLFDSKREDGHKLSDELSARMSLTSTMMFTIVCITMLIAIALGIFISRLITRPVQKLVESAEKIADGDLNVAIEIQTKDEIGALAAAFRRMSDNLNETMSNIQTAADQVASGSKQVSASSISLSQGATEQASSVEELTASIEEIAAQTQQNANNSSEANQLAEAAKENAIHGNNQMKDMLAAMDEINIAASNISKIIKVIDEIAFQTNILALNAAVEAARAGQHGKGFAVVAEEVRNLAARSANAAKETTEMIEGSIRKAEGGTKIANETAQALQQIVGDVAKVARLVGDIAQASNEQAIGIHQINQGIMQVSQVIQANSSTSEESAAASEQLSSQAELLKEQVGKFRLRKSQRGMYRSMEELSPELMQLFEQMSEKKLAKFQAESGTQHEAAASRQKKIILSDHEFGKY